MQYQKKPQKLDVAAEEAQSFISHSKISFPSVKSESINVATPQDLKYFVPAEAIGTTAKEIAYSNGKKGYDIGFILNKPLADIISGYINSANKPDSGWQILFVGKANLYSVFEAKNDKYYLRINHGYVNENRTKIIIQAIES